ncbi:uroporphyrinogen III methyltransferase/synthase [Halanaerobium saccharolyticum]|uniref:uroporphyrinogen-III C-methyltransferase n=1 Tax=Halanaerobium saccharolyticum TaxID=43595 RepID=A0A4V3G5U0_9FIRM|nr:uroporphyrinogen-III C-methyltransferase [Halanaerobium saccharolyticum]RAK10568.1 uroporphyrinogen III methyltransferase/synthase [Halanaerobium saccharolyticum]TDW06675.1 uroporphyrinogen III methyltransferase/synthase [Halanaerobium saccharolyticum]TDX62310.1 uroporphyrinogen III methyltransferase/synthase [Halanaerobium saccharolyticum]
MKAKVYLTGAGPGDPALLTLKAKRAIKNADVILYDRLANDRFLEYASPEAEKIYVGKKAKDHHYTQSEIETLMVEKVQAGKTVCRLKGGDPFIYGRGGEEALKLKEAGIDFEIIPGISSSLAVPLYAGIPLTQRHLASSFAVITGHEAADKDESTIEIEKIAAAVDTLIVLMGVGKLPQTVARVLEAGKSPDTPVALVRWGSRSNQQTITGTLADIVEKVEAADFKPPAVIIIGQVVNLREKLGWFENKKLLGKNILVTRPRGQAASFVEMIEAEAGNAVLAPTIKIKSAQNREPLQKAVKNLAAYTHLIFTSVNGVKYFMQALESQRLDLRALAGIKIMTIGSKTAAELKQNGIRADFIPDDYSTAGILEYLKKFEGENKINFNQSSFLLPRADIAPQLLEEELKKLGAEVNNVEAYRTESVKLEAEILELLLNEELDLLTFTSSSTVENFISGLEKLIENKNLELEAAEKISNQQIWQQLKEIPTACIGPVTAEKAEEYGLNLKITAAEYTIEGLFAAILKYYF